MSESDNIKITAEELKLTSGQVKAVAALLADKATVPFIARYRKEVTGNMDEVAIIAVRDRLEQLAQLDARREAIIRSLSEQGKLTPELEAAVNSADTMSVLEDIYLPYRPKKRTRAMIAREKGLETLAQKIFAQGRFNTGEEAEKYINTELGVGSKEDALQGAMDIIAEEINETASAREKMRRIFTEQAAISTKVVKGKDKDKDGAKYRDYFEWSEPARKAPSHRILAILRGVDEGVLTAHFVPEEDACLALLEGEFVKGNTEASQYVRDAARDCYKRLMGPSMETELKGVLKSRADAEAIKVFAENVRELLLASPMGEKPVLALDPGLRTGCKLVCLSAQGSLLHNETVYPLEPHNKKTESAKIIRSLCDEYKVSAIAIGNGTGGREATDFCRSLNIPDVIVTMVNESGASVYSASEIARREFPDHDVTVRGAVSIGRRLMDPLAELVKIDPKSIGVGQYQHDVDQKELKRSLEDVVSGCVNSVGVEVNTASGELLSYVSGLSPRMAGAIVEYRAKNGPFRSRDELKKVTGMGARTFEQAAGFLRIRGAVNPLDSSAVHPESYGVVQKMAADLSCSVIDLIRNRELREKIKLEKYITSEKGMPTLKDIYNELEKPGRDPRREFELFTYSENVKDMKDLEPGMSLPGVVTNVTAFGAFVDIGVHQDGLVHISHLSDSYVQDPHKVVKVNQKVTVTVLEVDIERKRISLSMKQKV